MHPRNGGPPRVVNGSAVALARAGCQVEIVALGFPQDEPDTRSAWPDLPDADIALHLFRPDFPRQIGRSAALRRYIAQRTDDFDVLHIHCIWETALADAAAVFRAAGKPVLVSPHGMLDRWQLRQSSWKKRIAQRFFGTGAMLGRTDAILYGTQDEANEAAHLGLPGKVVIMPNGFSPLHIPDPQSAQAKLLRQYPELGDWDRTVLFFSRLHPKKGLDLLIDAFGRVRHEFPKAGLFAAAIAQDREYEAKVRSQIAQLGGANIALTTELSGPEAKSVFIVSDIFALPSHQEGFSIAIVEAAGAGIPLLITNTCHMQEVEDDGAGYVVPATVDGLANGLRQILSADDAALEQMSGCAKNVVAARYTWDRVAVRLIDAYESILSQRRHG
ncbi:glycosyltransferase [Stakelama marina]|uniref:Glycosyltransferase n=1 Tax=Stakelama marina TaxID=2826939 RepID=A0A8T4IAQ7_9SPHN|nr:glycosyltransferase [Stakelama marina]MBR0552108.1 glycosyltransferase [Stakelama marina]